MPTTVLTTRSAKRRVARKLRRERAQNPVILDSDEERERLEDEEDREERERGAERERLAGLVRVAQQRFERAREKLDSFIGETPQAADEEVVTAPPTVDIESAAVQSPPGTGGGLSSGLGFRFGLGARVEVDALSIDSDSDSRLGTFRPENPIGGLYNRPGSNRLSPPPSDNYSNLDPPPSFSPVIPSPPTPVATLRQYFRPPTPFNATSFSPGPSIFRSSNTASDNENIHFHTYDTPSPPSPVSAVDDYPWSSSAATFTAHVPPPPQISHTPLLSPETRDLASETSVLLELLSRSDEIAMAEDAQTQSIDRAFENITKLRRHCRIKLSNRDGKLPKEEDEHDGRCIIGCGEIADVVLQPCHHLVLCEVRTPPPCSIWIRC